MAVHNVTLNLNGGRVEVELAAGNRHIFSYRCFLMDADGGNPSEVASGNTIDTVPDRFLLQDSPQQLAGRFLSVSGLLTPVQPGANQNYSVEIHLRQQGSEVAGSPVIETGQLSATIAILEFVRMQ